MILFQLRAFKGWGGLPPFVWTRFSNDITQYLSSVRGVFLVPGCGGGGTPLSGEAACSAPRLQCATAMRTAGAIPDCGGQAAAAAAQRPGGRGPESATAAAGQRTAVPQIPAGKRRVEAAEQPTAAGDPRGMGRSLREAGIGVEDGGWAVNGRWLNGRLTTKHVQPQHAAGPVFWSCT